MFTHCRPHGRTASETLLSTGGFARREAHFLASFDLRDPAFLHHNFDRSVAHFAQQVCQRTDISCGSVAAASLLAALSLLPIVLSPTVCLRHCSGVASSRGTND